MMNRQNALPILLCLALFGYLLTRAIIVPITDDEYMSYHHFIKQGWWAILTGETPQIEWAGNNHLLNTLLMKIEITVFGLKDWAVRLHSLAAFLVCYYYVCRILGEMTPSPLKAVPETVFRLLFYLLLLFLNPYLLDFFALARGYALSMAAWAAAFYYAVQYAKQPRTSDLWKSLLGIFIAVWANFSAVYCAALFGLLFLSLFFRHRKQDFISRHFAYTIATFVLMAVLNGRLIYLSAKHSDMYGGTAGLFTDMAVTYVERFVHQNEGINRFSIFAEGWTSMAAYALMGLLIWFLIQVISLFLKTDKPVRAVQYNALFQFLGVLIISKCLFLFFKAPYPMGRTSLLFSFPFWLSFIAASDILVQRWRIGYSLFLVFIPFLLWHFSQAANLDNTREWWRAGDAKQVIAYLESEITNQSLEKPVCIAVEAWQYCSIAFYTEGEHKDIMKAKWTDLSNPLDGCSYLFLSNEFQDKVWAGYKPVKIFRHGVLYRR